LTHDNRYAARDALVETSWVAEHLHDPTVRLIEADEDVSLYEQGHIHSALKLNWHVDVQDALTRDFISRVEFARLLSRWGISHGTTVVFYGDKSNWYACYSFWLFRYRGHPKARVMNGGRQKWVKEGRPLTTEVPGTRPVHYVGLTPNPTIRAYRTRVMHAVDQPGIALVDVRTPEEYRGEVLNMAAYPQEGAQRPGHIPGATSIPWRQATRSDGTFKPLSELQDLYASHHVTRDKQVITYCRIGERAAHTWFALTQLLGYPDVRNYDGSWTEWGSLVRAPIARGGS
jgi:thiosulfate/3-mercaptopyruvate sulfurtransferase